MKSEKFTKFWSAIFFVSLSVSGLSFLSISPAFANDLNTPQCEDIKGEGTYVSVNGVNNSGKMIFNPILNPDPSPLHEFEACIIDDGNDAKGIFVLKGWAWNDNVGWVSFFCGDEDNNPASPYTNLEIPCGNELYGVSMEGMDQQSPGTLHGYAWGDNTGWINFNCTGGVDSLNNSCGGVNYKVQVEMEQEKCIGEIFSASPPNGCLLTHPVENTFAWSDNVGWIDFTNIKFPGQEILDFALKFSVEIESDPDAVNKINAPIADGKENYKIHFVIKTFDDKPLPNPEDYDISLEIDWIDTVHLDQTQIQSQDYNKCESCGAVTKPLNISSFSQYGNERPDAYTAFVRSIAPTSNMNGYDNPYGNTPGDGTIDFSYEEFILPKSNIKAGPHELILKALKLKISKQNAEGTSDLCIFNGQNYCTANPVPLPNGAATVSFKFRPAAEVTALNHDGASDFIVTANSLAKKVDMEGVCRGELQLNGCNQAIANLKFGLDVINPPFKFIPDADNDDIMNATDPEELNINFPFSQTISAIPLDPTPEDGAPPNVDNPYIYSIVQYQLNGKTIKYFSNKLPRVLGTFVINPVASIRGNVYSSGVTNPQTGINITSIGDVGTNILRDTLVRNVANLTAGKMLPDGSKDAILNPDGNGGFSADPGSDIQYLLPENNPPFTPKVYFYTGNIILDKNTLIGNDVIWSGEKTIITVGGNIFINSNLYNDPKTSPGKEKLGIIALKNLKTGAGGNIYISPNVTNIQANIFADGSLFSYDGDMTHIIQNTPDPQHNLGEPVFNSFNEKTDILANQLYIEGSIASLNTIGGAIKTPPIIGNGQIETAIEGEYGKNPSGRSRARLYDLNHLRYYGLILDRDAKGNALDQQNDGKIIAIPVWDGGDLIPPQGAEKAIGLDNNDYNAVYIYFDPPTQNLAGFEVDSDLHFEQKVQ